MQRCAYAGNSMRMHVYTLYIPIHLYTPQIPPICRHSKTAQGKPATNALAVWTLIRPIFELTCNEDNAAGE